MTWLQEQTQSYYTKRREEIRTIADRLIATNFYFELKPKTAVEREDHSAVRLTGNILCKFPPGSKEIQALGEAFRKRSTDAYNHQYAAEDPCFVISERWKSDETLKVVIGIGVVETMVRNSRFHMDAVTFIVSKRIAETNICLSFGDSPSEPIMHPISGFPKCLLEEERKVLSKTRHSSGLSRTRTPTRAHHRGTWTLPDQPDKSFDPISRYQHPDYVFPGDADWRAISQIKQKFTPPRGQQADNLRELDGSETHELEMPELDGRGIQVFHELAAREVYELPTPFPYQTSEPSPAPPYE
ncbi:hypothetical protein GJ744_000979 [Endocarpon pusillum]|uniref:Uncharacterized protein n=1 Tax=Endocarpon pusillum TaxID=364733 RepID=A0A8H7AAR6_9EURO|nr:hypothetical protein GJ744_000979 [Endocarpon pusillum]